MQRERSDCDARESLPSEIPRSGYLRQIRDARCHRALRIGQRIDDGEMVGSRGLLVTRLRPGLLTSLRNGAALRLELARFKPAGHGIENTVGRDWPKQRRNLSCFGWIEAEVRIDAGGK